LWWTTTMTTYLPETIQTFIIHLFIHSLQGSINSTTVNCSLHYFASWSEQNYTKSKS
jgi:hypothetical protein